MNYEEERKISKAKEKERLERIAESRKGEVIITSDMVVDGLKYIAEHREASQDELIDGLLELGCNFSYDDINSQFETEDVDLREGMKQGNIACGASVIANMRNDETSRAYGESWFLSEDNEYSVYHFIRIYTGDKTYTKRRADYLSHQNSSKSGRSR